MASVGPQWALILPAKEAVGFAPVVATENAPLPSTTTVAAPSVIVEIEIASAVIRGAPGVRLAAPARGVAGGEGGAVIPVPPGVRVLIASRPVDFRKGADSLAAFAKQTLDPFSGAMLVLGSRRADRIKGLVGTVASRCSYGKTAG